MAKKYEELYISENDLNSIVIDEEITDWLATRWNLPSASFVKGKTVGEVIGSSNFAKAFKKSVLAKARVTELSRRTKLI